MESKIVKKLVDELNMYRNAYYNDNISLIGDKQYDLLYDKLCELESATGIVYTNSPTVSVGYNVVSELKKVKHDHPLLSLAKETDIESFRNYFNNKEIMLMAKMDGLTCSIHYENGELKLAESRGNGHIGEDITHNVLTFCNLPRKISYKGELIIDGECIIDYETFEKINTPLIEKAISEAKKLNLSDVEEKEYIRKHTYANPRNLASGSVRQLDSSITAQRKLRFVAWKLYRVFDTNGNIINKKTFDNSFDFLEKLGFETAPHILIVNTSDIEQKINELKNICEEKKYPIDGMVGTFNDIEYGESLGATGHHPKHSLAFKFYQEDNETTLLNIEWNTSRTGLVNPVAIFEPVEIDGTIVSRATLSNVSVIKDLQLGIGDTITLIKAHQIIPQITNNLTRSGTYNKCIPIVCPCCKHLLTMKNDNGREMLYCTNDDCMDIKHDKISNFASREGMNIVGISEERLRTLMEIGLITDYVSIYDLYKHREKLESIEGFGKTSVEKLLNAIDISKECKFVNVLVALGIPNVGKSSAKVLSKYCLSKIKDGEGVFQKFLELALQRHDWSKLADFGVTTSEAINEYVIKNYNQFTKLVPILNITDDNELVNNLFNGDTFCITGKLNIYDNRESLVEEIEKYGGKVTSSVTSKTKYLITNDKESGSSKNKKAAKFGTKIIDEEEFAKLINKNN